MTQSFKCPACAAPLEYTGGDSAFIKCTFCGNSVIVPEELRSGKKQENPFAQLFESSGVMNAMPSMEQIAKLKEIKKLVQEGNKIQAIKIYRETFGTSLKEAKDAVEKLEAGQPLVFTQTTTATTGQTEPPSFMELAGGMNEVAVLLREGNKIAAIKRYRELTGVGLAEAKEAVEKLEAGHPLDAARFIVQQQENRGQTPAFQVSGFQGQQTGKAFGCSFLLIAAAIVIAGAGLALYLMFSSGSTTIKTVPNTPPPKTTEVEIPKGFANVVNSFGSKGIGEGQLNDTRSIATDRDGRIYLADYTGGRVQVFDSEGKFIVQWFPGDSKKYVGQLSVSKNKVTANSDKIPAQGNAEGFYVLYVLQSGEILRINSENGQSIAEEPKVVGRGFADDMYVTSSEFFIIDSHRHIVRFDSEGKENLRIEDAIKDLGDTFTTIEKLAVDGRGFIYALSHTNDMVYKFSREGKYQNKFGGRGDGAGQINSPHSIAVDGKGRVYVSDSNSIRVFDENGRYIDSFSLKPSSVIFGMTFNSDGQLLVTDRERIYKFAILK